MYKILSGIARLLAPILSFTADEIWSYLPHSKNDDPRSIFLNDMPSVSGETFSDEFIAKWEFIYNLRADANKALELKRSDKVIGSSLEANITIHAAGADYDKVMAVKEHLPAVFIVSDIAVVNDNTCDFKGEVTGLGFDVVKASGERCERCWIYDNTVGSDPEHPTLCARCAHTIK